MGVIRGVGVEKERRRVSGRGKHGEKDYRGRIQGNSGSCKQNECQQIARKQIFVIDSFASLRSTRAKISWLRKTSQRDRERTQPDRRRQERKQNDATRGSDIVLRGHNMRGGGEEREGKRLRIT